MIDVRGIEIIQRKQQALNISALAGNVYILTAGSYVNMEMVRKASIIIAEDDTGTFQIVKSCTQDTTPRYGLVINQTSYTVEVE